MKRENFLIVADSIRNADMLYAVGVFIHDPFIYLHIKGRCHVVVSDLELNRARKQAPKCRVIPLSQCWNKLKAQGVRSYRDTAQVIRLLLKEKGLRRISVPEHFPLGLARKLRRLDIKVKVAKHGVFPQRVLKSPEEIKKISAALMMAEVGLAEGIQALKYSRITRDGKLIFRNSPLTAERLRAIIDTAVVQAGGTASQTIVAGGRQGCEPHAIGHGPLKAHQPIILDVFPRSSKTGYFGDITRTVVRGRATEEIRNLYNTVKNAQDLAVRHLTGGTACREVHANVQRYFSDRGYKTGRSRDNLHGFYHGTGHGLGLEIHESPFISTKSDDVLATRMVVACEPGLYYAELNGGVRLEDVVLINDGKPRKLSKFEKVLEI